MNVTRQNIYRLANHGELIAGANWNNGLNSGSQARNANNWRWNANSNIAGQFAADTGLSDTPGWIRRPCRGVSPAKYKKEGTMG